MNTAGNGLYTLSPEERFKLWGRVIKRVVVVDDTGTQDGAAKLYERSDRGGYVGQVKVSHLPQVQNLVMARIRGAR